MAKLLGLERLACGDYLPQCALLGLHCSESVKFLSNLNLRTPDWRLGRIATQMLIFSSFPAISHWPSSYYSFRRLPPRPHIWKNKRAAERASRCASPHIVPAARSSLPALPSRERKLCRSQSSERSSIESKQQSPKVGAST